MIFNFLFKVYSYDADYDKDICINYHLISDTNFEKAVASIERHYGEILMRFEVVSFDTLVDIGENAYINILTENW